MSIIEYECKECEHRIKIYNEDEQAVFCGCNPEGFPMIPVPENKENTDND